MKTPYDNESELREGLTFTSGNAAVNAENFKFGYNEGQNMTKRTNNTTVTTYTVNNLNQVTADGTYTYTHDNNGNRTGMILSGSSVFYSYDDENQLTQAETATTVAMPWRTQWTYDARGRVRTRAEFNFNTITGWVLSSETRYMYDGRRVIQERNSSNVPLVTYVRGLDLSGSFEGAGGIGGMLSRTAHTGANGATLTHAFCHADANGNITKMVNSSQTSVADYKYDPFGRTISSSGTLANANTYRFSSKELMGNSGFYYCGFRFYDPITQRWPNRDPLGEEGGINLYGFVGNNPITFTDAFGLEFFPSDFVGPLQPGDTRCPEGPPGTSLHDNMGRAKKEGDQNLMGAAPWFYGQVKGGGPWDFKQSDPKFDDFGNSHYGATGAALGFSSWALQNEAGINQQKNPKTRGAGAGTPGSRFSPGSGVWPYGDQKTDNRQIRDGIRYNRDHPVGNGPGPCG